MRRALFLSLLLALPATVRAAEPELALSVNHSSAAKIFPGWPLLVQVLIANPSSQGELVLAPRGLAWARAVKIMVTGPDGKTGTLPFELGAEPPSAALRLPAGASTQFSLVLPEGATRSLAPGRHVIAAVLEISGSGGWNGTARATASWELPRTGEADADQRLELALLRAMAYILRGSRAEARKVLEEYLKANRDAVPALRLMAEILEKEGEIEPAYRYAARAVSAFREQEEKAKGSPRNEPPAQLLGLYGRLHWTLLFKDAEGRPAAAAPAAVPAAGRPPTVSAPAAPPAQSAPVVPAKPADATARAMREYEDTVGQGDELFAAGDYFEAVRVYDRAWRISYDNKLKTDGQALDERLARARKARDVKKQR